MLHIILLILKILGLLLLGLLGLIAVLLLVILLSPAAYRVELSGRDTLESVKGNIRFHWLLCLVSGEICYEDGVLTWRMRAGWKRFRSGREKDLAKTDSAETPSSGTDSVKRDSSGTASVETAETPPTRADAAKEQKSSLSGKHSDQQKEKQKQTAEGRQKAEPPSESGIKKAGTKAGGREEKSSLYERIKKFWEKIKYTFQKICDNIRSLAEKKERLDAFVRDETHKSAFLKLVCETKRFLKVLRPKKADISIEFGFTDPAVTGYVLGLISLIYPVIGEYTQVVPDFEQKKLAGRCCLAGRIRAVHVAAAALRILLNKDIRTTYRHIKNFDKFMRGGKTNG